MSIATVLFSESQLRLYRWLFGEPGRSFHLSELRRLTGLGSASLQRELRKLVDAGMVSSEYVGNQRRFQANPDSPVYQELVAIVRKTLGLQPLLADALASLRPRLRAAWIYGSVAKGTDTARSDIDLMLVTDGLTLGDVLECLTPLEAEIGRKINPTCYSPDEFKRRRHEPDSFVNRVLAQPILPLIGTPDDIVAAR
ncbi:MAG: nucleotidyltransferase domain-containing protein [Pseudomonadota bacterium]|jgi:predicted nucleotidyltransferase